MSALNALLALRRYTVMYPDLSVRVAAHSILDFDADSAGCDFEAGIELFERLPEDTFSDDPAEALQRVLANILGWQSPVWARLAPYGRERVKSALNRDEEQCLRSAGLFEEPPGIAVVTWWDRLAQAARATSNDRLLEQGREAERLSLQYEIDRLRSLKLDLLPKWIAIEDNSAGYDIRSYDHGITAPVSRLIEVKSSTRNPPRMILTRNEWETAAKYGDTFVFHIWALPAEKLQERTVADIAAHIPIDQGYGNWSQVEIELR